MLLVPIYVFIFLKLDAFHVLLWDESYFAVHATEMYLNNSWFLPYFDGEPINAGTKPPLQYLFQILFIHVLGIGELALRLPSAISAALSVLVVFHFMNKRAGGVAAWISAFVLLTNGAFIHYHTGRGMEADAMLALVMLLQVVFFSRYILEKRSVWMILLGLMIAFGFLVKSVAGFMLIPGFIAYMLLFERNQISQTLKSPSLYVSMAIAVALPVVYIWYREVANPGFIDFIMERHVGRFGNELGYYESAHYYFKLMTKPRFILWSGLSFVALYYVLFYKSEVRKEIKIVAVMALSYFILVNIADTKYEHYLNPLHPLFALLIGYMGGEVLKNTSLKHTIALLTLTFLFPCYMMFIKSQSNYIEPYGDHDDSSTRYLYAASKSGADVDGLKVFDNGFEAALVFYKHKLAAQGQHISLNDENIEIGDRVLTANIEFHDKINRNYVVEKVDQLQTAIVYHIKDKKYE